MVKCFFRMWPDTRRQPLFAALLAVLLIGAIAWEVVAVATKMRQYHATPPSPRQLAVTGTGKVRVAPDIAVVHAGFTVIGADVRVVQGGASRKMTALVTAVKAAGVAAADIQTAEFAINPQYRYDEKQPPRITGYEARQSIEIRIRNLELVNDVLAAAGGAGATNIGGLELTIDDPDRLQADARGRAIADARAKAAVIAAQLGVRLGRAVSFSESGGMPPPIYARELVLESAGGPMPAPSIEKGSTEVIANVTVTYELQ